MLRGIDISHWNTAIKWDVLANEVDFVVTKATQGGDFVDNTFYERAQSLKEYSLLAGSYCYVTGSISPEVQARFYCETHAKAFRDYPAVMALDIEDNSLTRRGTEYVRDYVTSMVDYIIEHCRTRPFIYLSREYLDPMLFLNLRSVCPGWIASWFASKPPIRKDLNLSMWQYSSVEEVLGIAGPVDTDVFFGDIDAWKKIAVPPDLNGDV